MKVVVFSLDLPESLAMSAMPVADPLARLFKPDEIPSATVADGIRAPEPAGADRGANGRFVAGNKASCGNPHARRVAQLRSVFLSAATPEKMQRLAEALFRQAEAGDVAAARLVLAYTLGQPGPAGDPDALDLDEWKLAAAMPDQAEFLATVLFGSEPAQALELLRKLLPKTEEQVREQLIENRGLGTAADVHDVRKNRARSGKRR